jgi:CheY-like chemotaxis protein
VTDATLALNLLDYDRNAFDVIFSDVVMPGISGVELGRIIRLRWPELPVVLTSGYSHVLAADASHGFPLLHKPYSAGDLAQILQHAIANLQQFPPALAANA